MLWLLQAEEPQVLQQKGYIKTLTYSSVISKEVQWHKVEYSLNMRVQLKKITRSGRRIRVFQYAFAWDQHIIPELATLLM